MKGLRNNMAQPKTFKVTKSDTLSGISLGEGDLTVQQICDNLNKNNNEFITGFTNFHPISETAIAYDLAEQTYWCSVDRVAEAKSNKKPNYWLDMYPIDTAVKDGSKMLLLEGEEWLIGGWLSNQDIEDLCFEDDLEEGWYEITNYVESYDKYYYKIHPTHWLPLPPV